MVKLCSVTHFSKQISPASVAVAKGAAAVIEGKLYVFGSEDDAQVVSSGERGLAGKSNYCLRVERRKQLTKRDDL